MVYYKDGLEWDKFWRQQKKLGCYNKPCKNWFGEVQTQTAVGVERMGHY